jgi:hypothetical protein
MAINWSLLQPSDPGGAFQAGFERARVQKAIGALTTDPANTEALGALAQYQPALALQIRQSGRQEAEYQRGEQLRGALATAIDPATGAIDPNKARAAYLSAGDAEGAIKFDQAQAKQRADQIDIAHKVTDYGLQLLGSVRDQASYDAARAQYTSMLQQYGLPAPELPAQYSPDTVRQLQMQSLSAKEQLELEKPTNFQREMASAGIMPGTKEYRQALLNRYAPPGFFYNGGGAPPQVLTDDDIARMEGGSGSPAPSNFP